jgi:nucleoside-diphosphate-sugar epimerase
MPILITGAAGQDGILLARKLLKTETDVVGICRKNQAKNLRQAVPGLSIYTADLTDFEKVHKIINKFNNGKTKLSSKISTFYLPFIKMLL